MQYTRGFGPWYLFSIAFHLLFKPLVALSWAQLKGASVSSSLALLQNLYLNPSTLLPLLPYKTELKYLPGLEDLLSFPYTSHPPFNTSWVCVRQVLRTGVEALMDQFQPWPRLEVEMTSWWMIGPVCFHGNYSSTPWTTEPKAAMGLGQHNLTITPGETLLPL